MIDGVAALSVSSKEEDKKLEPSPLAGTRSESVETPPPPPKEHKKVSVKDFEKAGFLGEGSYAKVLLVKHKTTGKVFAMKAILKSHMVKVCAT